MPNVDKATRILNKVCSSEYSKLSFPEQKQIAREFFSLPNEEKPISFRGVEVSDLLLFFEELNEIVSKRIRDYYKSNIIDLTEDSNDNKVGSDLIALLEKNGIRTEQRIEMKFGQETNRNIGNKAMDSIFPINSRRHMTFSGILKLLTEKQKKYVLEQINYDEEKSYEHLKSLIQEFSNTITNLYEEGDLNPNSEKVCELLSTTGSMEDPTVINDLLKLRVDYDEEPKNGIKIIDAPLVEGDWEITKIGMADNSIRAEIRVKNAVVEAKFLLNWKNNYKYNGKVYPAKLGLGSTSWNVWIKK